MEEDGAVAGLSEGARALVLAGRAETSFDTEGARKLLATPGLAKDLEPLRRLLALRVRLRDAPDGDLATLTHELLSMAETDDLALRARVLHTLGALLVRRGLLDDAERALTSALALSEDAVFRTHVLDGFGQALLGAGAWNEARRVLLAVAREKKARGDRVGTAITVGHTVLLELRLGRPADAARLANETLSTLGALPILTRLRLATLALGAEADAGLPLSRLAEVESLVFAAGETRHPLLGFAAVALARTTGAPGEWLEVAHEHLTAPSDVALLRYWEAVLGVSPEPDDAYLERMEALFRASPLPSEAEVLTRLFLATRAKGRDPAALHRHLDAAYACAARANNPLWLDRVDRACRALDPEGIGDRLVERFSGRSLGELSKTIHEEVTIVFADLVGFTPRTLDLQPDDVMATVRGLFELAVPLMTRHRVRPISYLGDGLLAVAEGEGHAKRGLAFAQDLVARAGRVSTVRKALGEKWGLDLRAGVATGPVVLGTLGTLFKLEFAAIGPATNLAARLQGAAAPGEVMAAAEGGEHPDFVSEPVSLSLKGWTGPVGATRFSLRG